MGFARVLLVSTDHAQERPEHPQVGLGYLSEALEQAGIDHRVLDLRLGGGERSLHEAVRRFGPDLVGFSLKTLLYRRSYALIERLKQAFPGVATIAGGPHVSTFRERVLAQCPALDYAATGEGEQTLVELCRGDDERAIAGLFAREQGEIRYGGERRWMRELDRVAHPTYRRFDLDAYATDEIPLLTSRGCPYACVFCAAKAASGRRFDWRSARDVADEIEHWARRGRRRFAIIDDNFTLRKKRVLELCDELEARGLRGLEFRCPNGVRADRVDRELLGRMREAGFRYIAFGVESGSERVLKAIRKGESLEAIRRAIGLACELGYDVALFFIVGLPGETWEDIEASVRLAREFPVVDAKFFNAVPLPGTELFEGIAREGGFTTAPEEYLNHPAHWQNDARRDPKPVFVSRGLPHGERVKALAYVARAQREIRGAAERARAER